MAGWFGLEVLNVVVVVSFSYTEFWDSIEGNGPFVMPPLQEIVLKLLSGVNAEELKFKEFFLKVAVSVWSGVITGLGGVNGYRKGSRVR